MRVMLHWLLWMLLCVIAFTLYLRNRGETALLFLAAVGVYGVVLLLRSLFSSMRRRMVSWWRSARQSKLEREIRVRDAHTESPLERMLAQELDRRGIRYVREYRISRTSVDFAFPASMLVVECDGWRYHHDRQDHDRKRDAFLRSRGWRVVRFTGEELRTDVSACARQIAELL